MKQVIRNYLLIVLPLLSTYCFSQHAHLLNRISDLQAVSDTFYNDGLFPSERLLGKRNLKEDNNIFFTALTLYTLQSLRDNVSYSEKTLVDSIIFKGRANYPNYQNRNGDITYNFWQVRPDQPFPNSKFLSGKDKMKLPDDLDDTSIIFLTKIRNDSLDHILRLKMMDYTNHGGLRSTFKSYRNYGAYYTWFGKKMKQDFDICVMSNVLLFVFQKGFALQKADMETIRLIEKMIMNDDHLRYPQIISPHYQTTTIILYHVARLIAIANHDRLNRLRQKIIQDLYTQLNLSTNRMEKVVLLSSLHRLNEEVDFEIDLQETELDFEGFYWFNANPFSGARMFTKRLLGKMDLLQFKYKCNAYYWALILELEVLSRRNFSEEYVRQN